MSGEAKRAAEAAMARDDTFRARLRDAREVWAEDRYSLVALVFPCLVLAVGRGQAETWLIRVGWPIFLRCRWLRRFF